jgi:hypothetical protein
MLVTPPECAIAAAEAERDNALAECRFLRVLCLVLGVAVVWAGLS